MTNTMEILYKWNMLLALKGFNPKCATFRQHYYPEGGWGWVITICAAIVQIFTSGIQLSFGILYIHILKVFGHESVMSSGNFDSNLERIFKINILYFSLGWSDLSFCQLWHYTGFSCFLQVRNRHTCFDIMRNIIKCTSGASLPDWQRLLEDWWWLLHCYLHLLPMNFIKLW